MPQLKMTIRSVDAIKPPATGQVDYVDTSFPGFGLRVSQGGRKSWFVMYRLDGRRIRQTLGTYPTTELASARKRARDALKLVEAGIDPSGRDKALTSVEEVFAEYLERHAKPNKRSWKRDELIFKKDIEPAIGRQKIEEVKKRDLIRILDAVVDRGAPIQANRTLEILRKFFNWAVARDIIEFSPCQGIPKPSIENQRDRVLNEDEIRRFWNSALEEGPVTGGLFVLRLITAQRGAEVKSMRWDNIEGQWWTIPPEVAKNGKSHRVWLSDLALEILDVVRSAGDGSEWVFPSVDPKLPRAAIHKAHSRIRNRAGLENYVPHDLRRTAASLMTGMGINRLVVSKILNHVESGVTAVYDRHSYDNEKKAALDAWGRRLSMIVRSKDFDRIDIAFIGSS